MISWFTIFISFYFLFIWRLLSISWKLCCETKQTLHDQTSITHVHQPKRFATFLKRTLSLVGFPHSRAKVPNNFWHLRSWNSWTRWRASDGRQWLPPWSLQRCHYSMFGNPLTPGRKWMYYECPADGSSSLSAFPHGLQALIDGRPCRNSGKPTAQKNN